ncbi:peptidyl-tRNA hydrolase [Prolixibacter bellariivorans]|uniref:Peptidyl-tRNA hydrolase n=1 Tax=Prolixibacter bellariivorans TaxID=314319 RepID=A0A5M4B099_9BACT|nr:aminoacyl-tRNA hydrolase [Prolixibacter bellariivorans]GET33575.1 peptidyl-tRNA hydrolase [Prolixibacter bellariivorans]
MKYLIVGLGNIGEEYQNTRHNIGFKILDALAGASNISFSDKRYGAVAEMKHAGRTFILLKPSTFMNLSGKAVQYWMQKEKIPIDKVLILVDDLALPVGKIRLRAKGSDAGHNGLKNINQVLGRQDYARLRFGIGDDFPQGYQIDHVLGKWSREEEKILPERIDLCIDIVKAFAMIGVHRTMSQFNSK